MLLINWIAALVATLAAFVLGAIWYGPLFSRPWMREMGVGRDFKPRVPRALLFGMTLAMIFVAACLFSAAIGPQPTAGKAILSGIVVGVFWVASSMTIAYLFAARSLILSAIDGGYAAAQFILFGVIFYLMG
jgi:uncharacterized membrane protein